MAEGLFGRPKKEVDTTYAAELLYDVQLPATRVAEIIGVSRPTLYKRLAEEGLAIPENRYTDIPDSELESVMKEVINSHPNAGEVYVTGHLRSKGIYVQRCRIRQMMHVIDPEGVADRLTHTIQRRKYAVPCPNFMWHIDGAHKLIQWKFVVHAAIDGFSRTIVFLQCSNNNRAETVTNLFLHATHQYGWPIRVRTDYGGENVGVWDQMNAYRGLERKPVIAGSSVHNTRVERLHRDVNLQVGQTFKALFLQLEQDGILDRTNNTDLFCLHYTFLPEINKALTEFRNAHNHHSISTEGNKTPLQLFYINQHLLTPYENVDTLDPYPGIPVNELMRCDLPHVSFDPIQCPLSRRDFRILKETIRPAEASSPEELVTMYKGVSDFVGNCLER